MASFCLQCGVAAEDDKRFCGNCGRPLTPGSEAEARLSSALSQDPHDAATLEKLIALVATGDGREGEVAELSLRWCEVLAGDGSNREALEETRARFLEIPIDLLKPESLDRAVDCFILLVGEGPLPPWLESRATAFAEAVGARVGARGRAAWCQACLGWAEARDKIGDRGMARALLRAAAVVSPEHAAIRAAIERMDASARRRRQRVLIGLGVAALVVVAAKLGYDHFTTARVLVRTAPGFEDAIVTFANEPPGSVRLDTVSAGAYRATLRAGRRTIYVVKEGFSYRETVFVARGGSETVIELPSLKPVEAPRIAAADLARIRGAADPLLAFVNLTHNTDGEGRFKAIAEFRLRCGDETVVVRGFSNTDVASHASGTSVWTLQTASTSFEIEGIGGPSSGALAERHEGHDAVRIETGSMHMGEGWSARTWIYCEGPRFMNHTESQEFSAEQVEENPPWKSSRAELKLRPLPGLPGAGGGSPSAGSAIAAPGAHEPGPLVPAETPGRAQGGRVAVGSAASNGDANPDIELVRNGSFESGAAVGGGFIELGAGSGGIHGWSVTAGSVDLIAGHWPASEGARSLDMSGSGPGAISQVLSTVPQASYLVRFDLAANVECGEPEKSLRVEAAGQSATFAYGGGGRSGNWARREWTFTADGERSTLVFRSLTAGACGPALDNVSVRAASSSSP